MTFVLVVILVIFLLGGLPQLGVHNYGYAPSGVVGLILLILVILLLTGHLDR